MMNLIVISALIRIRWNNLSFFASRFSNRLFGLLHYLCSLRCLLFVGQSDLFPQLCQRAKKKDLGFCFVFFFERHSYYDEPRVVALNSFLTTLLDRIVL